MVIEITPKARVKIPPFMIIGAVVCFLLAALLASVYFYFNLNIREIDQQVQAQREKLIPIEQLIEEKENQLLPIKKKIDDFGELISKHETPLEIFGVLEKDCFPLVWFSDFQFRSEETEEKQVSVSGHTDSFNNLEQQANFLKEDLSISSLSLSNVAINEKTGDLDFDMNLIFKKELFTPSLIIEEVKEESEDEVD